jgi:hypothetical protein
VALGLSIISVAVEVFLHATGTFHWEYWWWNVSFVLLIIIFGYLWFYLYAAWVYDAPNARKRWTRIGGSRPSISRWAWSSELDSGGCS